MNQYLDRLKRTLTGMEQEDPSISTAWRPRSVYSEEARINGRDWPQHAHTMIGIKRLDNLQECIEQVIIDDIPGDLIETGVWRGGACIFMRAVLRTYEIGNRIVWVADSFEGFPDPLRDEDKALASQVEQKHLAVTMEEVVRNFAAYDLLDEQVRFLKGWFRKTLPGPVRQLSILRLDGDLYESTMDALMPLYPLLSPGGFCIIDDWNVPMCRNAVADYRAQHVVTEPIEDIDGHSVYWRKDA